MTKDQLTPPGDAVPCGSALRRVGRGTALTALIAAGFVATMAFGSSAASAAPGGSTDANVGVDSGITMTGLTPSFLLSGTPGQTVTGLNKVTFNVETNNPTGYAVTVQSRTSTMAASATTNADTIPIAALTVRESNTSVFTPLSTGTVTVHTQALRSANGGDELSNDFQIRIPVVNVDTYSATLDYLATANL